MNRLYLRELTAEDVNESYLNGFNDSAVTEFLEVDGKSLTKENVTEYIEKGRETGQYFMYAICLTEDDRQIGNLKIGPINHKHGTSDLVTVIWDSSVWGKGMGTEAIKHGNKLAFEQYNLRKLSGGVYSGNHGSLKAYTGAGWVVEGRLFNHYQNEGKYEDKILISCFNPFYDNTKKA